MRTWKLGIAVVASLIVFLFVSMCDMNIKKMTSEEKNVRLPKEDKALGCMTILTIFMVPIVAIMLFFDFWADENTYIQETIYSPSGIHAAYYVKYDTGALGSDGSAYVYVKKVTPFDKYMEEPFEDGERIYWDEFEITVDPDLSIGWKDDTCLVINGKEYRID